MYAVYDAGNFSKLYPDVIQHVKLICEILEIFENNEYINNDFRKRIFHRTNLIQCDFGLK